LPPEDPAAGTHGQVLPLLLHEGLKGKVDHEGHQGLQEDHLGGQVQDHPLDGREVCQEPDIALLNCRFRILWDYKYFMLLLLQANTNDV
jgi:hypothetical protein